MTELEQNSHTRFLLARLDVALIDLESLQTQAIEAVRVSREVAKDLGAIKARIMVIRDELRPILDSSAPREVR